LTGLQQLGVSCLRGGIGRLRVGHHLHSPFSRVSPRPAGSSHRLAMRVFYTVGNCRQPTKANPKKIFVG
jgi:hypothetical protein